MLGQRREKNLSPRSGRQTFGAWNMAERFSRPLRGLGYLINDSFPAINRWAIVGRPLPGLYSVFSYRGLLGLHALDDIATGNALDKMHSYHAAAGSFDFFATVNFVKLIVAAFYQNVGQQIGD